jgi:SAM-dependent methyltransferase
MTAAAVHRIGRHEVELVCPEGVGPATPYSPLLASCIPDLSGATVVDLGTGLGIQGIVALLQGAARVYVVDIDPRAEAAAVENTGRNGVADRFTVLPPGDGILPLPQGARVDMVICNPAQLPVPETDAAHAAFDAGRDGRRMIEAVIKAAPGKLVVGGHLLMTHNSMTDLPTSLGLMRSVGLEPRILSELTLEFRPFINRAWLDELGAWRGASITCVTAAPTRRSTSSGRREVEAAHPATLISQSRNFVAASLRRTPWG